MKYYVFIGGYINAAHSLYNFINNISNKQNTFIWGFSKQKEKDYNKIREEVQRGEGSYAFLYIGGIDRILLGGKIEGFF